MHQLSSTLYILTHYILQPGDAVLSSDDCSIINTPTNTPTMTHPGDASMSSEDDMDANHDSGSNYRMQSKFPMAATNALSNALKPPSTPSFASQQNPEFLGKP